MPTILNKKDLREKNNGGTIWNLVLSAIGLIRRAENKEDYDKIFNLDEKTLEIVLTCNGVELDFAALVDHLMRNYERSVKKKAEDIIADVVENEMFVNLRKIDDSLVEVKKGLYGLLDDETIEWIES